MAQSGEWVRQFPPCTWSPWLGNEFQGVVRYRRRFGQPTGLGARDRVWLVVEPPMRTALVQLNEVCVGSVAFGESALRVQIQDHIRPRNQLSIDVTFDGPNTCDEALMEGGLTGAVCLEIEPVS